jgi:predicted nucleic acid-binding protein
MEVFALDTSCMIAAVCGWHQDHEPAAAAIEKRLDRGDRLAVPAHALAEAYAVLTRLPSPHRLAPVDAWTLLKANFAGPGAVAGLAGRDYVTLLARLAGDRIAGGRTYDAIIRESARRANASVLLTFNPTHFDPAPAGLRVVVPGA